MLDVPRLAYRCVLSLALLLALALVPSLAEAGLPGSQKKPFTEAPSLKERVRGLPKAGTGRAGRPDSSHSSRDEPWATASWRYLRGVCWRV